MIIAILIAFILDLLVLAWLGLLWFKARRRPVAIVRFTKSAHCITCNAKIDENDAGVDVNAYAPLGDKPAAPVTIKICKDCVADA